MRYEISPMTRADAREIVMWRYEAPYDIYNIHEEGGNVELEIESMLDDCHYAVRAAKVGLVGFFCYGVIAQVPGGWARGVYRGRRVLDIGLGMRPDLTGRGLGQGFVQAGVDFAVDQWRPNAMRLTVASFNRRAIRTYERVGFQAIDTVTSNTPRGPETFIIMLLPIK
ncbi:MAG: GNAT family N-acetyltransferase [Firmicutes bacterium]|nr:GNAT family N-acetyltransferase [Bacillota bacterium]